MDLEARIERYEKMKKLREERYTLEEIGAKFSLTRERARQILASGVPTYVPPERKYPAYVNKMGGREATRELVRIRDKHKCQDCGKKWIEGTRRLDVHHLNGLCGKISKKYDKRETIPNLITLCHKCHFNRPEHRVKAPDFGVGVVRVKKTHCSRGHPFSGENLYLRKQGYRECRICRRASIKAYKKRKREKKTP